MIYNHNLTESDNYNIDVKSQLEHQIHIQETKEGGWKIDKINSTKIGCFKTGELIGSSYVKIPLRPSAVIKFKNDDIYCFIWSLLVELHHCENDHPNRVSNYRQYFNELNMGGFDFTNGFKSSYVHKFEKLTSLSKNISEKKLLSR